MRPLIAVIGMHRSGTSAVAGALARVGFDMGSNLMPPSPANPRGYYESVEVVRTHDRLLRMLASGWDSAEELPDGWGNSVHYAVARSALASWLSTIKGPLAAVKDPRMCRLYPLWRDVASDTDSKLIPLVIRREPRAILDSLVKREGWERTQAQDLLRTYSIGIDQWLAHEGAHVVELSDLMENPRYALRELRGVATDAWADDSTAWDDVDTYLAKELLTHGT